ncbi:uncharacterized protein LOC113294761 [Papaver somniferum]|uniref:uncharacterized protein LOC113294761 n=1 Tax=Papaver somniferum TaxID=3469 RepID=UPI000E6F4B58|nr:uncharacterized protein LOC113294761 [Papaver somniferum]
MWFLEKVVCGSHNHPIPESLLSHSYVGHLTEEEENIVESLTQIPLEDILDSIDGFISSKSLHSYTSSISFFNGTDFSEWKENVEFTLGVQDIDLALQIEKRIIDDKSSTEDKDLLKKWERSDRLSIQLMRMHIDANIKESIPKPKNAKKFMEIVKERFKTADKSLAGKLMDDLTTMKYTGVRSMHQHVIEMRSISAKLTEMKLTVDENFLVQFILNSLPPQYAHFQVHYNTITEK